MTALLSLKPTAMPKVFRNGFEAYKLYTAVSLHITSKYDGVKYSFKKPAPKKWDEFNYPEKFAFDRIARNYKPEDWVLFYGRNAIHSNWVRDFLGDVGESRLLQSKGFLDNPKNQFEPMFSSYLIALYNKHIKFSSSLKGETPFILSEFEQGRLSAEFLILVDAIVPFLKDAESFIYKDTAFRLHKYSKLFTVNEVLLKDVIKSASS